MAATAYEKDNCGNTRESRILVIYNQGEFCFAWV